MTFLETFVDSPWAIALGWALLHSFWQGGIAAALVGVVMVATKSPRIRYAVGCLVLLGLLFTFGATLFRLAPEMVQHEHAFRPVPFPGWQRALLQTTDAWSPSLAIVAPWLAPCWMAGVFIFYLRYAAGFLSLARLSRRGICAVPEIWQDKLADLSAHLRVSRPVRILETSLADAPILIGHFRPLILMPVGLFTGLPAAQVETILLHELAHIRRHDYLLNALQNLVDGLLFYHPAVWWISHVVRAEREKCCDDVVVGISGNPHEYARALTALEETRWSGREPAVAAKGGSLMKRIRRLLYPTVPNVAWTPVFAASALFIATAITLGAWQQGVPTRNVSQSSADRNTSTVDPYNKWLSEDVVYIIDGAERTAFLKLTTNEERDHFIEQFWERRNPEPGTSANKFKEEHYRRIAVTNKHYSRAGTPGWQTDRGHMYILYGPPDEIDSHPQGIPHPWESWGYRHMENDTEMSFFRFIDGNGTGDFRLAPSNGR
jgi:GWxTD domain-containing protein